MKERAQEREREAEQLRARVRQLEDELHELKMQKRITALAPRDGPRIPRSPAAAFSAAVICRLAREAAR